MKALGHLVTRENLLTLDLPQTCLTTGTQLFNVCRLYVGAGGGVGDEIQPGPWVTNQRTGHLSLTRFILLPSCDLPGMCPPRGALFHL